MRPGIPRGELTDARDLLGQVVAVEIDRPLGSSHPRFELIYEVNYGFVPGMLAPDGEFLDAYVLGEARPLSRFCGECIAVIHRLDDNDDKLVVVPPRMTFSDDQIRAATRFQERHFQSVILRREVAQATPAGERRG
jgi:inorganic pyrophosphatase